MNKLSVLLFGILLSLAAYAGGTSGLMASYGSSGGGGGIINITNRTIGANTAQAATWWLDVNLTGSCGGTCGGMLEVWELGLTNAINDEYLLNWQGGTYAVCVGSAYEISWHQVSGTMDTVPFDDSFTNLPQDTWSFSEWASAIPLCDSMGRWMGGVWNGPFWSQNGASADAVITVSIRKIDLSDGPVTATLTFTP